MDAAKLLKVYNLLNLAERGEIDPWDVQVIEVIDRYLSELVPQSSAASSLILSQSGQAFARCVQHPFKANAVSYRCPSTFKRCQSCLEA